jgi:hypothetical protein
MLYLTDASSPVPNGEGDAGSGKHNGQKYAHSQYCFVRFWDCNNENMK